MALVELREHITILEVAEDHDDLVETLINLVEKEFEDADKGGKRASTGGDGNDAKKAKA